jgi:hypothetical protein
MYYLIHCLTTCLLRIITFQKRNDREEIRRRLAMGAENDEYYSMGHTDRPGKKPSLHSRLQNGVYYLVKRQMKILYVHNVWG